ncbi:hypothetical protein EVAR_57339_1 [Eumeta japonica]|uniref:Uncharacterized protein n=1 Tax=Eumeta variegata TaxID=151549 RepID=A0A4C1Z549_EUMVA|nr:hypothetical protein EVAR_57339_1 [Eumeta japonica]
MFTEMTSDLTDVCAGILRPVCKPTRGKRTKKHEYRVTGNPSEPEPAAACVASPAKMSREIVSDVLVGCGRAGGSDKVRKKVPARPVCVRYWASEFTPSSPLRVSSFRIFLWTLSGAFDVLEVCVRVPAYGVRRALVCAGDASQGGESPRSFTCRIQIFVDAHAENGFGPFIGVGAGGAVIAAFTFS